MADAQQASRSWTPGQRRIGVALALVSLGALVAVAWVNPGMVRFWPFSAGEFVQTFTPLVLVALFIERALEVFVSAWRGADTQLLEKAVEETGSENARRELARYKAGTRRLAFLGGVTLGTVVAAVGIRALGLFVDPAVFELLSPTQQRIFNTADVLLTGALLGGGADGLHQLVQVFVNFMASTAKKVKSA